MTRMSFLRSCNHGRRRPGGRLGAACQPAGGAAGVGVVVLVPVWPPMVPVDPLVVVPESVVVADVDADVLLLVLDGELLVEESVLAVTVVVVVTVDSSLDVDELEGDESAPPVGAGSSTGPVSGVPV